MIVAPQRVADLAAEHGLSAVAEDLVALARPALRLIYSNARTATGQSKLGGLPDLPPDVAWPHAKWPGYEHEAMTFFGQLALAELDPAVWGGPREGLLSFFCRQSPEYHGVDVGGAARVIHTPAGAPLAQADPPDGLFEDFLLDEQAVQAVPELTLPTVAVDPAEVLVPLGLGWDGPLDDEAYWRLEAELAAAQGFGDDERSGRPPAHRVLGWPRHVQGDVLPEIVLMHFEDTTTRYTSGDLERHAAEWRLLLQVEADRRLGGSFGDGGALFFGMPTADLPTGDFSRVQAISQTG